MATDELAGRGREVGAREGTAERPAPPAVSPLAVALAYLVALTAAEVITAFVEPRAGLLLHALLLVLLLAQAAAHRAERVRDLLLALSLAPLIRLLSLSLPLTGLPLMYWYLIISVPLFAGIGLLMRALDFSWPGIGVNLRTLPVQLAVALTGLLFGYLEYQILRPEPLVEALTWQQIWLPALILMVSTGLAEELIFRGVMQRAAAEALGWLGVVYVAALFAVFHVGHQSLLDVGFVFVVALFFGWVVRRTRSLFGVTLAHGFTNILLFLVMPFVIIEGGVVTIGERPATEDGGRMVMDGGRMTVDGGRMTVDGGRMTVTYAPSPSPIPTSPPPSLTAGPPPAVADPPSPTSHPPSPTPNPPSTVVGPPSPTVGPPSPTPTPRPTSHVVRAGENLHQIGWLYGMSWESLLAYNGDVVANPAAPVAGRVLMLPPIDEVALAVAAPPPWLPTTHLVHPGEGLFQVSLIYGLP